MQEEFFDGEIAVVAVYLDKPDDRKPTGEPIDLSFFLKTEGGVTQLDGIEEPYLIDWLDWKVMHVSDALNRRLIYEADDGTTCDIELDTLPIEAPEVVYAVMGRMMQTEFGGERPTGRQDPGPQPAT